MKVLFVARRFPPSIGGMQQFAYDLSNALPNSDTELIKITWGGSSKLSLIFAIPWLFCRAFWALLNTRSIDVIHMQDAVLSPPGWLLATIFRKPWVVVAHGLDLTFKLRFYQAVNVFFARRASAMIAISQATGEEALARGITKDRLRVVPLGVSDEAPLKVDHNKVRKGLGLDENTPILITVGRLAKRKGVAWFIENVLPKLDDETHYVVIGEGVNRPAIEAAIEKTGTEERVHLTGEIEEKLKLEVLRSSDIFVMPNIIVPGDMEGFGIVAHEAALAELPVVASNIEGIAQAIQDKKNGVLVETRDAAGFADEINKLIDNKSQREKLGRAARKYTIETFGWSEVAKQYRDVYKKIT